MKGRAGIRCCIVGYPAVATCYPDVGSVVAAPASSGGAVGNEFEYMPVSARRRGLAVLGEETPSRGNIFRLDLAVCAVLGAWGVFRLRRGLQVVERVSTACATSST